MFETVKKIWQKSWWSKLLLVAGAIFLWPLTLGIGASLLLLKRIKSPLIKWVVVLPVFLFSLLFNIAWISTIVSPSPAQKEDQKATATVSSQPVSSPAAQTKRNELPQQIQTPKPSEPPTKTEAAPTIPPTSNLKNIDLKKLFSEIDNAKPDDIIFSVDTDSGHIQAHREDENENMWVVIEIMNRWPEVMVEFSLKNITRNFLYDVYHSEYNIKQAGITINGSSGRYYRVFLGFNQARTLTDEDWKYLMPSNFYEWIKEAETSRNEEDRANATFVEENIK